jgi:hypothetical protein
MQRQSLTKKEIQSIPFYDENNNTFLATDRNRENSEQNIANIFVEPDDCILELGGRYGTVSCIANNILNNPINHVVVEPDKRVLNALNMNRSKHNSYFFIFDGIISKEKKYSLTNLNDCNGYGAMSMEDEKSTIPILPFEKIQNFVLKPFTCLIADCEGFLETFLFENIEIMKHLRMVTFEKDGVTCDYDRIVKLLIENGFELVCQHGNSHFVYIKK